MSESDKVGAIAAIGQGSTQPEGDGVPRSWRDSKWHAIVEFLIVGLIFYADYRGVIPFSKTPELLLLGWISLRVRRLR